MKFNFLNKIFGSTNDRKINALAPIVEQINSLEKDIEKLSDTQLFEKAANLKKIAKSNQNNEKILPEAFALVREASKRTIGQRHYDVQLMGGIVLHQGKIAEMKTGEGKTLSGHTICFFKCTYWTQRSYNNCERLFSKKRR